MIDDLAADTEASTASAMASPLDADKYDAAAHACGALRLASLRWSIIIDGTDGCSRIGDAAIDCAAHNQRPTTGAAVVDVACCCPPCPGIGGDNRVSV